MREPPRPGLALHAQLLSGRLARPGNVGVGVGYLAFKAKSAALQLQYAWSGDEPSLNQWRDIPGFGANRRDLVGKRLDLRFRADDMGSQLIDLLPDNPAPAGRR